MSKLALLVCRRPTLLLDNRGCGDVDADVIGTADEGKFFAISYSPQPFQIWVFQCSIFANIPHPHPNLRPISYQNPSENLQYHFPIILSSLPQTPLLTLALSPGKGFNSSFGSIFPSAALPFGVADCAFALVELGFVFSCASCRVRSAARRRSS